MTTGKIDQLMHMANRITDVYAAMPGRAPVESVVSIGVIVEFAGQSHPGLNATAARAVEPLKQAATAA